MRDIELTVAFPEDAINTIKLLVIDGQAESLETYARTAVLEKLEGRAIRVRGELGVQATEDGKYLVAAGGIPMGAPFTDFETAMAVMKWLETTRRRPLHRPPEDSETT